MKTLRVPFDSTQTLRVPGFYARTRSLLLALFVLTALAWSGSAEASCWHLLGWTGPSGPPSNSEVALLASAPCDTVPLDTGWVEVTHGLPPQEVHLRISLNDPLVTGSQFGRLLYFAGFSANKVPIIHPEWALCGGCPGSEELLPYPPDQGKPAAGKRVRLRHCSTNRCIYTLGGDADPAYNGYCSNAPGLTFVLDYAGPKRFRLRHELDSQCLYTSGWNGAVVSHWSCWSDPAMTFYLQPEDGGFLLRNLNTSQCIYGNSTPGGEVHSWGCWSGDPDQLYWVDLLE